MKKELLRGPRAGKMAVWAVGGAAIFIVYTILLFVGMAVAGVGYRASPFLTFLFVAWATFGIVVVVVNLLLHYWVVPREVRAGYTTGYRIHQEVDYVDPGTGYVLRVAGEGFLEPDERRRREALVKQLIARNRISGDDSSSADY